MKKGAREADITDLPHINFKEARYFLGIGMKAWRVKWDEVFQYKVVHWRTSRCLKLNLESLVAAVYPDAANAAALRIQIAHAEHSGFLVGYPDTVRQRFLPSCTAVDGNHTAIKNKARPIHLCINCMNSGRMKKTG